MEIIYSAERGNDMKYIEVVLWKNGKVSVYYKNSLSLAAKSHYSSMSNISLDRIDRSLVFNERGLCIFDGKRKEMKIL